MFDKAKVVREAASRAVQSLSLAGQGEEGPLAALSVLAVLLDANYPLADRRVQDSLIWELFANLVKIDTATGDVELCSLTGREPENLTAVSGWWADACGILRHLRRDPHFPAKLVDLVAAAIAT